MRTQTQTKRWVYAHLEEASPGPEGLGYAPPQALRSRLVGGVGNGRVGRGCGRRLARRSVPSSSSLQEQEQEGERYRWYILF